MIKRFFTRLSFILMLAAAAPALSPALPVQAAARVLAEESASVSTVLSSGKFTTENGRFARSKKVSSTLFKTRVALRERLSAQSSC